MTGGVRAGYLSPPLPLPPLTVIYPLWMSALSEAAPRGWVAPTTDDHWLSRKNTSVCQALGSLSSVVSPPSSSFMNASYSLASVPLISGARTQCWQIRKKRDGEGGREEEGTCIRHVPVLSSYRAIY